MLFGGGALRFYTADECEAWLDGRKRRKPDAVEGLLRHRLPYPREPYRINYIAHWIATNLTYRMPALLWMTEWGIWPSSENWHLYYKLRQSYSDQRLLHEAPGHLCLEHETEDLASFLQVAMHNGWGGYVLTQADYANAFFSHDEFIDFFSDDQGIIDEVRKGLSGQPAAE
jgi:hypothetical protein